MSKKMIIDGRFEDTEFVIEANSYEKQSLWERFHDKIKWEEDCSGTMYQLGELDNRPVSVSFFWAKLNGHRILFYDATSQVVDHVMIEKWLKKYCNPSWDNGRRAHCDANNFHLCLHHCEGK